ncbi:hypothetical protein FOA52_006463 [Chlamydomonas sp. UWO 241]|nr:hypothetical protein FOA52_006463 [Chlamydomonas sp. UWO 241]
MRDDRDDRRDDRRRSRSRSPDRRRRSPIPSPRRDSGRDYDRRRSPDYDRRRSPVRRDSRSPPRGGGGGRGYSPQRGGGGGGGRDRSPPRPGCQLFVAGFNFIANERDVTHKFGKYGRVRDVRIVRGPQGESRGFGFVDMETPEDAQEVIREMDQTEWNGRKLLEDAAEVIYAMDGTEWNGRKLLVEVAKRPRN